MILVFDFLTCFFSKIVWWIRFISRNGYRTRWIFHEGNRDATSEWDTRSRLWTIVNLSSYVLSRAIRTHFAFSLSTVQTKMCKLTTSDLNIYTDVHRRVLCSRTYTSFIQLDKCVCNKSGSRTILSKQSVIRLFKCLAFDFPESIPRGYFTFKRAGYCWFFFKSFYAAPGYYNSQIRG